MVPGSTSMVPFCGQLGRPVGGSVGGSVGGEMAVNSNANPSPVTESSLEE